MAKLGKNDKEQEIELSIPTAEQVENAKQFLANLGFISKPVVVLNSQVKKNLLTLLLGSHDKTFFDLAMQLNEKFNEYYAVPVEVNTTERPVGDETKAKTALCLEIIKINAQLNKLITPDVFSPYTSKYNALSALYPSPQFLEADISANIKETDSIPMKHSAFFTPKGPKPFFNIAVAPPASSLAYHYITETFPNASFLIHSIKSNSISAWSKYTNGRTRPMAISWGLFLMAIGLHPLYKLALREDTNAAMDNTFFKDLYPNWNKTFNAKQWKELRAYDLLPFEPDKEVIHEKINTSQLRAELLSHLSTWYEKGNQLRNFNTAIEVYHHLNNLNAERAQNPDKQNEINELILEMSKASVFGQNRTRWYILSFSEQQKFSSDLDERIYKQTSVATYLHLEPNPNPNLYIMLRSLFVDEGALATSITHASGVSRETWARYEQGTRIPHNTAWTSVMLTLDAHPIYRLVKRSAPKEIEAVYKIYRELHQRTEQPRLITKANSEEAVVSEFCPDPGISFKNYLKEYFPELK